MPSKNDPENQSESQPSDLFSSVETRAMLEEFRELVRAGILRVTPENEVLSVNEPPSGAGQQPRTAGSREEDVAALDKQLLEWLDRKRQQKTGESRVKDTAKSPAIDALSANIRQKVIERVAQKIVETWDRAEQSADSRQSLREQVVDRVAEDILRRWQRNLE